MNETEKLTDSSALLDEKKHLQLKCDLLHYLSSNDAAHFTNTLSGEPEIDQEKKRKIAENLLSNSYGLFLARFGPHLLENHLAYFDSNVSEDEKYIVDAHLKQLRKIHNDKDKSKYVEKMEINNDTCPEDAKILELRNDILDHLSMNNKAYFKSQQVGEPELDRQQKRNIAEEVLDRNKSLFLSRFGTHLEERHLVYFEGNNSKDSYEVEFYLNELRRNHCKVVSKVGIKNRRFEALRQMLNEGSYFNENEMRKRNPLLYEQMVGQFLSDEEKRERQGVDTTNITFVNLLLEQMDRETEKKLKNQQMEAEDDVMEEEDTSSDEEEQSRKETTKKYEKKETSSSNQTLWGESYTDEETLGMSTFSPEKENYPRDIPQMSESEKQLLMEEFRSNMFESFLQGRDDDYDYSQVDFNPDYDNLEVSGLDEEEKYFDSESPEEVRSMDLTGEEDELEEYMFKLKPETNTNRLAEQIQGIVKL